MSEKILSKVQPAFEKFKGKTFTIKQNGYTRNITVEICGYNEKNPSLFLIGKLDNKKGISGFKSKCSSDFIRRFDEKDDYVYLRIKDIEEAYKNEVLKRETLKRRMNKKVNY